MEIEELLDLAAAEEGNVEIHIFYRGKGRVTVNIRTRRRWGMKTHYGRLVSETLSRSLKAYIADGTSDLAFVRRLDQKGLGRFLPW